MENQSLNKNSVRLFKNTFYMYIRTAIVLIISLYVTRIILSSLGEIDYGIYSLIGSVVILFTFLNSSITQAVQRFLTLEIAHENQVNIGKVFSASMLIQAVLAIIFILFCESLGVYIVKAVLNVDGRENAAYWVFQFSVISFILGIFKVPFEALVIANERLSFFAIISVIEAVLKLGICYLLYLFTDRLIAYSGLLVVVSSVTLILYLIFCFTHFRKACTFTRHIEKNTLKEMLSFSGWNLFGGVTNIGTQSLFGIILNFFYGVLLNSALGIVNQVNAAMNQFITNFQTSFRPQIVKAYGQRNDGYFKSLIRSTSKISFLLTLIPVTIIILNTPLILRIWLGEYPDYSVIFCRYILIICLLDALTGPYYCAIAATGKIKWYQVFISCSFILDILSCWFIMFLRVNPNYIMIPRILTRGILNMIIGMYFMKIIFEFNILDYVKKVLIPLSCFIGILLIIEYPIYRTFQGFNLLILSSIVFLFSLFVSLYFILSQGEKNQLKIIIQKVIKR